MICRKGTKIIFVNVHMFSGSGFKGSEVVVAFNLERGTLNSEPYNPQTVTLEVEKRCAIFLLANRQRREKAY